MEILPSTTTFYHGDVISWQNRFVDTFSGKIRADENVIAVTYSLKLFLNILSHAIAPQNSFVSIINLEKIRNKWR